VRRLAPRWDFAAAAAATGVVLLAVPGLVQGVRTGFDCTARYLAGERYPCLGAYH
jgi:hypothetical protein